MIEFLLDDGETDTLEWTLNAECTCIYPSVYLFLYMYFFVNVNKTISFYIAPVKCLLPITASLEK